MSSIYCFLPPMSFYTFAPLPTAACRVPLFCVPPLPLPSMPTFPHFLAHSLPPSLSSTSLPSLSFLSSPPPSPFPPTPSSLDLLPVHPALATAAAPFSFFTLSLSPYLFLLPSLLSALIAHPLPPASSPELSFPTRTPPLLLSLQFNFHLFPSSSLSLYLLSLPFLFCLTTSRSFPALSSPTSPLVPLPSPSSLSPLHSLALLSSLLSLHIHKSNP
jgi:hypothetical protein